MLYVNPKKKSVGCDAKAQRGKNRNVEKNEKQKKERRIHFDFDFEVDRRIWTVDANHVEMIAS
jgi:hypothetical protein